MMGAAQSCSSDSRTAGRVWPEIRVELRSEFALKPAEPWGHRRRATRHSRAALSEAADQDAFQLNADRDLTEVSVGISSARIVMLGGSTHGSQEFYLWRRLITEWLIVKHGFQLIAVEEDWPDAQQIDRYSREGEAGNARAALEKIH